MITSSYPRHAGDGAGSYVRSLSRTLVRMGHAVHVVAPYDPLAVAGDDQGVVVHRFRYVPGDRWCLMGHGRSLEADTRMKRVVPLLVPPYALAALAETLHLHRRERFDLLHGHWAVPGGAIAGVASRLLDLPLVITLHGSDVYVTEHSRAYALAARSGYRRAGCVTAVSDDLRRRAVATGLAEATSLTIPCGVDPARYATCDAQAYRARLGIPAEAPVIGALGRLVHKKGFTHLVAAMPAVLASVPDAYCVIGGDGDLAGDLAAQARDCGLDGRILFPGHVSWEDTPAFYGMCAAVAVPSVVDAHGNVDGLPLVLLEAMASGVPVAGSRVAGIREVLEDGVTGLLAPPGDAGALAVVLVRLLGDGGLRARLGEAGRRAVCDAYCWEAITARFVGVYEDLAAGRGGAG